MYVVFFMLIWHDNYDLVQLTNLYSMVFLVTHVYKSEGVCCDTPWVVELSITSTLAAEGSQEATGGVEHLRTN